MKVLEPAGTAATTYPSQPPNPVPHPLLIHEWSDLALLHWRYPAAWIQALLPHGLEVDVFDGCAWVGLVPFHCTIRPRGVPRVPWMSSFPEMNVRTYVRGPHGEPAVWFISLEAARLVPVLLARSTYGLNYCWSRMNFSNVGDIYTYRSRRRWPQQAQAEGSLAIEAGDPQTEPDELESWFTNRWRFYCATPAGLATGLVAHGPWPLRSARVLHVDPSLVSACGISHPEGEPLALFGGRVSVRMSRPYLVPGARKTGTREEVATLTERPESYKRRA